VFKNNLTKIDIIKNLSAKTGYPISFSKKLIDDLIKIISKDIKMGNINLKNVGSFKLINKKERIGRNPKTNEKFLIKSRKSISFTPSKKILNNLNKFL